MSLKNEVKKTGEGRGLLGLALAVGIGVGILAPLVAMGFAWIKGKVSKPAANQG